MPAPDGAMEVYAAFPVDGIMPSNKLLDAAENMIPKSDLDRTSNERRTAQKEAMKQLRESVDLQRISN